MATSCDIATLFREIESHCIQMMHGNKPAMRWLEATLQPLMACLSAEMLQRNIEKLFGVIQCNEAALMSNVQQTQHSVTSSPQSPSFSSSCASLEYCLEFLTLMFIRTIRSSLAQCVRLADSSSSAEKWQSFLQKCLNEILSLLSRSHVMSCQTQLPSLQRVRKQLVAGVVYLIVIRSDAPLDDISAFFHSTTVSDSYFTASITLQFLTALCTALLDRSFDIGSIRRTLLQQYVKMKLAPIYTFVNDVVQQTLSSLRLPLSDDFVCVALQTVRELCHFSVQYVATNPNIGDETGAGRFTFYGELWKLLPRSFLMTSLCNPEILHLGFGHVKALNGVFSNLCELTNQITSSTAEMVNLMADIVHFEVSVGTDAVAHAEEVQQLGIQLLSHLIEQFLVSLAADAASGRVETNNPSAVISQKVMTAWRLVIRQSVVENKYSYPVFLSALETLLIGGRVLQNQRSGIIDVEEEDDEDEEFKMYLLEITEANKQSQLARVSLQSFITEALDALCSNCAHHCWSHASNIEAMFQQYFLTNAEATGIPISIHHLTPVFDDREYYYQFEVESATYGCYACISEFVSCLADSRLLNVFEELIHKVLNNARNMPVSWQRGGFWILLRALLVQRVSEDEAVETSLAFLTPLVSASLQLAATTLQEVFSSGSEGSSKASFYSILSFFSGTLNALQSVAVSCTPCSSPVLYHCCSALCQSVEYFLSRRASLSTQSHSRDDDVDQLLWMSLCQLGHVVHLIAEMYIIEQNMVTKVSALCFQVLSFISPSPHNDTHKFAVLLSKQYHAAGFILHNLSSCLPNQFCVQHLEWVFQFFAQSGHCSASGSSLLHLMLSTANIIQLPYFRENGVECLNALLRPVLSASCQSTSAHHSLMVFVEDQWQSFLEHALVDAEGVTVLSHVATLLHEYMSSAPRLVSKLFHALVKAAVELEAVSSLLESAALFISQLWSNVANFFAQVSVNNVPSSWQVYQSTGLSSSLELCIFLSKNLPSNETLQHQWLAHMLQMHFALMNPWCAIQQLGKNSEWLDVESEVVIATQFAALASCLVEAEMHFSESWLSLILQSGFSAGQMCCKELSTSVLMQQEGDAEEKQDRLTHVLMPLCEELGSFFLNLRRAEQSHHVAPSTYCRVFLLGLAASNEIVERLMVALDHHDVAVGIFHQLRTNTSSVPN